MRNKGRKRDEKLEPHATKQVQMVRFTSKMSLQEYERYFESHMFFVFQTGNAQQMIRALKSLKNISWDLKMPLNDQIKKIREILDERERKPTKLSRLHFKNVSQALDHLKRDSFNTLKQRFLHVNEFIGKREYEKSIQEIRFIKEHVKNFEGEISQSFIQELYMIYQRLFESGKIDTNSFCESICALHELTNTLIAVYDGKIKITRGKKIGSRTKTKLNEIKDEFNKKRTELDNKLLEEECGCRDMSFYAENELPYQDATDY